MTPRKQRYAGAHYRTMVGDSANLNQSTRHAQSRDQSHRDQTRLLRCQLGCDRSVGRGDVDTIDQQHRPLHDIFD